MNKHSKKTCGGRRTFSSRALWCSNSDLSALRTSTSLETPEGDCACLLTTVIRSERSCLDTRHSRCSSSSWDRHTGGERFIVLEGRIALSSRIIQLGAAHTSVWTVKSVNSRRSGGEQERFTCNSQELAGGFMLMRTCRPCRDMMVRVSMWRIKWCQMTLEVQKPENIPEALRPFSLCSLKEKENQRQLDSKQFKNTGESLTRWLLINRVLQFSVCAEKLSAPATSCDWKYSE